MMGIVHIICRPACRNYCSRTSDCSGGFRNYSVSTVDCCEGYAIAPDASGSHGSQSGWGHWQWGYRNSKARTLRESGCTVSESYHAVTSRPLHVNLCAVL